LTPQLSVVPYLTDIIQAIERVGENAGEDFASITGSSR